MMRIASYHNLPSGGAKRSLFEETKGLASRHSMDVFTLSTADEEFADLEPLVADHKIYEFEPLPMMKSPFGRVNPVIRMQNLRRIEAINRQIAADIDAGEYDLLYVNPCQFENCPSVLRFVERVPSVYFCHEPLRLLYESMPSRPYDQPKAVHRQVLDRMDPFPGLYRRRLRENDQQNMRSADLVLANSKYIQNSVKQIYQVEAQVNYKGVDTELFHPSGAEKEPMILSVGSITPLKAFDFIIQAMARIPLEERVKLVLASNFQNPPEKLYLEQIASESQVELVLLGDVSDQRLIDLYNRALFCVYAPIREPLGLVPLESMACGTAVVAVDEGGIKETIIDQKTGLLTKRDPDLFADAIRTLLKEPALAATYGKEGREHVLKHWTWDRAVVGLENHFRTVLN